MTKLFFMRYILAGNSGSLVKILSRICLFAIFFGMAALVIVTSVMAGFNRNIKGRLLRYEPHIVVTSTKDKPVNSDLIKYLTNQEDVDSYPFEKQDIIIRTLDGFFQTVEAVGVEFSQAHYMLNRGNFDSSESTDSTDLSEKSKNLNDGAEGIESEDNEDFILKNNEIILGEDLAFQLNVFEGSEILLIPPETLLMPKDQIPAYRKVVIKKVIRTEIQKYDAQTIFYNLESKSIYKGLSLVKGLELRLKDPFTYDKLNQKLKGKGWSSESWVERNSSLFLALQLEKIAMSIFLTFSALITSFIIFSVLTLLITQKRKDMGLLMAIGYPAKKVKRLFIRIGFALAFTGLFGGVAFGLIVSILIDTFPIPILPDIYFDRSLPALVDYKVISIIVIVSAIVAVLSAWVPARGIDRLTITDRLKRFL